MKIQILNRAKDKDQVKKQVIRRLQNEENIESSKKENSLLQIPIPGFQHYSVLMKLRIVISLIFLLITIPILLLIFAGNDSGMWQISAILFLLGYIMLFVLLFKLFRVQKL